MTQDMQREFDKHPIRVPVQTDDDLTTRAFSTTTNYYGPVVTVEGDHAQVAWDNDSVTQSQARTEDVAKGYEVLAQALVSILRGLPGACLPEDERQEVETTGKALLAEVTEAEPNPGVIKRGVTAIKGLLAPVAIGTSTGAGQGAQDWARTAIEQLGNSVTG